MSGETVWTEELRVGLVALLERLLDLPGAVQWRGEPQFVVAGASATIDDLSESGIGIDEISYAEGPTVDEPTEVTPTVHGLREATIQVSVWSPSQHLGESARVYTSRLRTRLHMPSADEELKALGLALVDVSDSIPLELEQSSRARPGSAVDIRVGFGVTEVDDAIPFIEHVRVYSIEAVPGTGSLLSVDETPLPDPLQDDTWTPALSEP